MRLFAVALLVLTALPAASPAARGWTMRDLGTLGGGYSTAFDVTDNGIIAGTSRGADGARYVFVWQGGRMRNIGDTDDSGEIVGATRAGVVWRHGNGDGRAMFWNRSIAVALDFWPTAIDDQGRIVGTRDDRAVLWEHGRLRDLGPGVATATAAGAIAGASEHSRAFLWRDGKMQVLSTPRGFDGCEADAVNDRGHVVGTCDGAETRAVLWQSGGVRVIGWQELRPVSISDDDVVVGEIDEGPWRGFVWHDGHLRTLGTLGGRQTLVSDANGRGEVVGASYTATGNLHAYLWRDGVMTDLARQGRLSLSTANAINERGDVVGVSRTGRPAREPLAEVPHHAVLWTRS